MKRSALFLSIGLFAIVLCILASRQAAIHRANQVMAPVMGQGWYNFETSFAIVTGKGPTFTWRVRYEQRDAPVLGHPVAIYVPLIGELDDWEVREMIDAFRAAEKDDAPHP